MSKTTAIIVAAGSGSRMGEAHKDKLFALINAKPVLLYSLEAFQAAKSIDSIIVVTRPENIEKVRGFAIPKLVGIVAGGADRAQSVLNGLGAINRDDNAGAIVAVHDAARPLVTPVLIDEAVAAAKQYKAAIPAVPVRDTVKTAVDGFIVSTPERQCLFSAQTPQAFDLELYRAAAENVALIDTTITDDSMLVERLGVKVKILQGSYSNIKITTPEDLLIAEALVNEIG